MLKKQVNSLRLTNIVASGNLNTQIDLHRLAVMGKNIEYTPKRLAAAIIRKRDPKSTALVFNSGKIIVTGVKSEDESR